MSKCACPLRFVTLYVCCMCICMCVHVCVCGVCVCNKVATSTLSGVHFLLHTEMIRTLYLCHQRTRPTQGHQ